MAWKAFALVLMLCLAGCTSNEPDVPPAAVDPTTGIIRGTVVDALIRPLPGAEVRIEPGNMALQTSLFGSFKVEFLPPGPYQLFISAPDHEPSNTTVQVVAGETVRPRVVLTPIPEPVAAMFMSTFEGRIDGALGAADEPADPAKQTAGVGNCTCVFPVEGMAGLVAIVIEAEWSDSIQSPEPTEYRWSLRSETNETSGAGPSRLRAELRGDTFDLRAKTFEVSLLPDEEWPAHEQSYTLYVSLWTVEAPPEGWTIFEQ